MSDNPLKNNDSPLKIGILGAARIVPMALLRPAQRTPGVAIHAIAARDETRARDFARRYDIPVVHRRYEDLLSDPEIGAVYIPLPNSLHCEWSEKALRAGKHVLCEKPLASNADEARRMAATAAESGRVLMEAFHYRFHPLCRRMKTLIELGEKGPIGALRHIETELCIPLLLPGNIRYRLDLSGGATMDVGSYAINLLRYLAGSEPRVVSAQAGMWSKRVDRYMTAEFEFDGGVTGKITCSLLSRRLIGAGARVVGQRGEMRVVNPFMPSLYHLLEVRSGQEAGGPDRQKIVKEKVRGETSYTYQLWSFLDSVRLGRPELPLSDSIANMEVIDAVYERSGLGRRGP